LSDFLKIILIKTENNRWLSACRQMSIWRKQISYQYSLRKNSLISEDCLIHFS